MSAASPTGPPQQKRIYTVSDLTGQIKRLLEQAFSLIWLEGEVSNLKKAASGHLYFTLKDPAAQISAVMFKGQARNLKFDLNDGLSIIGLGRVSVYEPRGNYQIILELIEPKGFGSLQISFEQLKERLAEEGLFDAAYKRPLPFLPRKICLITSPKGAVVHDMLKMLLHRFPNLPVEILPVRVQGGVAADEIAQAIHLLNQRQSTDVAILARGGGSLEDLQPFNTETVARAIFGSKIPIVSAVGHETDFTIADFVADLRAPTPTAAAGIVVPDKTELNRRVAELRFSLQSLLKRHHRHALESLTALQRRLADPRRRLDDYRLKLDDLNERIEKSAHRRITTERERWTGLDRRLLRNPLSPRLIYLNEKHKKMNSNILKSMHILLSKKRFDYREILAKLQSIDPMAVLDRGYSITRTHPDKTIVRDAGSVSLKQAVEIILAEGRLHCRVEGTSSHDPEKL